MAAACPPTPAAIVSRVDAEFPEMAKLQHLDGGTAIVKISLDAAGKVVSTAVQKSAGAPILDQAAQKAARSTTYKPATDGCKAVASVYLMVVDMHE